MRILYTLTILLICTLSSVESNAQQSRFKAGAIFGMNASQLDGDQFAGYHKIGFVAGLRGVVILTNRIETSFELLYSQRGSRSSLTKDNNINPFNIGTNFIEVPVIFNYKDWLDEEGEYYKLHFHAGLSFGRLISTKIEEGSFVPVNFTSDDFNKTDFSYLVGATFYTGKHLAFTFRWSRSFGKLYKNDATNTAIPSLENHLISIRTLYMF